MRKRYDIILSVVSVLAGFSVGFLLVARDILKTKTNSKTKDDDAIRNNRLVSGKRRVWDVTVKNSKGLNHISANSKTKDDDDAIRNNRLVSGKRRVWDVTVGCDCEEQ
jgi:hypothetical protein